MSRFRLKQEYIDSQIYFSKKMDELLKCWPDNEYERLALVTQYSKLAAEPNKRKLN